MHDTDRESEDQGGHKFWRFDPTVSTGTLLQIAAIVIGASTAYGAYREDRAQMRADIEQVKLSASRDRDEVKASFDGLRLDVKELTAETRNVSESLAVLKAQAPSKGRP